MNYQQFITGKLTSIAPSGIDKPIPDAYGMFPHQVDLVRFALRRGRSAIFADTGLGKTRMQIAWADMVNKHTGGDVLILAHLAVADQTKDEALSIGVSITHAREPDDIQSGINITNYDRLHKFDTSRFVAVVLDESSVIKHHNSKTLQNLLDAFATTPYKLCATATPAPNDWTELGTHAEFLGVQTRSEMLAEYFVHDGGETQTWRLKGHARSVFWKWVSSWGVMLRSPADLGYDATAYNLPPLVVTQHSVEVEHDQAATGQLFAFEAQSLMDRRNARRNSLSERTKQCADMVNSKNVPWIVWCDLNDEADSLKSLIPDAVEVRGSDTIEHKEKALHDFAAGKIRVLISKPSICGWGLNWQHCCNMAFVGVTDSFEAYYQAVRRCWRFGQTKTVDVHIFSSEQEGAVVSNLKRKESEAREMSAALASEIVDSVKQEITGTSRQTNVYAANSPIVIPDFLKVAA